MSSIMLLHIMQSNDFSLLMQSLAVCCAATKTGDSAFRDTTSFDRVVI
jgi:hypothetical protein